MNPLTLSAPAAPRVWLTFMTAAGNEENLREMVEPLWPYIDGIVAVVHRPCEGDAGLAYLEASKGAGKIIVRDWVQRHDVSASETLYAGIIQEGDLFIITDTLERPNAQFVSRCKDDLNDFMHREGVDCLYYFGKAFIVRYNEAMHYQGSPHWGLIGVKRGVEMSHQFPDEKMVRLNVRPLKRKDEHKHFCRHYLKYFVEYPAGSNHALLGIEQYGGDDPSQALQRREANRLEFRREIKRRGFPVTVEGFLAMCKDPAQMNEGLKAWLRSDKVFSDAYHWLVLGNPGITDTHRPADALPIP